MSECAPCGLKIALCELTCVVKLFIVAEEEVVEAGGGVAEGGGVECWNENPTKMDAMYVLSSLKQSLSLESPLILVSDFSDKATAKIGQALTCFRHVAVSGLVKPLSFFQLKISKNLVVYYFYV